MKSGEVRSPHLVLVGLPGSGKTTIGRGLGARLARPFVDFDEEIERREGRPISHIFAEHGEPYFRELERALTEEMRAIGGGMVLAPGGGWATLRRVVEMLRPPAAIVYLAASPTAALARMGQRLGDRPLLRSGDPLATLERLFGERRASYEAAADLVVDTEHLDAQGVTEQIAEWLSLFERNSVMRGGR